ncbi:MAG: glucosylceramidase [Lachnospiraceae bacterium]|nr:glucosylceramidase [Lachnospiraceae bacterium]
MKAVLTVTNLEKNIKWQQCELESGEVDSIHQVSVYPFMRRQTVQGFGGAFTEAAAWCCGQLPEEKRRQVLKAYFGDEGLRYTMGRVHMNSCDFSLGNYACVENPEDENLEGFTAERDEKYMIPMILEAQDIAGQPINLMLSPWSPPGFMKTNGEMNHGGSLRPEYRSRWAACMAKYASYYRSRGCSVKLMSIQNEPAAVQSWDSCIYTAAEEGEFAVKELFPALQAAGCGDIRILAWDHNKEILPYRAKETMVVAGAEDAIGGFAVHWYTGDHFDALRLVREKWSGKEIWFTEGCVEYSRFDGMSHGKKAEMYAHDILGNLNGGISGSLDWNLLLDAAGGPNHVGNFCEAPIMLNEAGDDYRIMGEYYYIGHFSRFIRPGAVCLGSSVYGSAVESVAFENTDGERGVVLLNRTEEAVPVSVTEEGGKAYNFEMQAHSIATLCWGKI